MAVPQGTEKVKFSYFTSVWEPPAALKLLSTNEIGMVSLTVTNGTSDWTLKSYHYHTLKYCDKNK